VNQSDRKCESNIPDETSIEVETLGVRYEELKAKAGLLAGDRQDIPRRVGILYNLFLHSGGNHTFSLMAAHGALWAYGYFEVGGRLGQLIGQRYFYNPTERKYRLGLLQQFAESFRDVNRLVTIDTYTNYYFTRQYGHMPGAEQFVPSDLLSALNEVHAARDRRQELPAADLRRIFEQSFFWEQETTVAPGVEQAVSGFDCRILRTLCLRPIVRFAYFPRCKFLMFRNFADKDERIEKGFRAYDLAAHIGWPCVRDAIRDYGVMPESFFESPQDSQSEVEDAVRACSPSATSHINPVGPL
jgi:hypothetical protein